MKKLIEIFILSYLLSCIWINVYSQASQSGLGIFGHNPGIGTVTNYYLGWDNATTIPLEIRQDNTTNPQNITFHTNGSTKMIINGNNTTTDGYVGIGSTSLTPGFQLDVKSHININTPIWPTVGAGLDIGCFMINGETVLQNGGPNNICVGVGAGLSNTDQFCTFVGYRSGYNSDAGANTFVGYYSGYNNTSGEFNTFIGSDNGSLNTTGSNNSFFGQHTGYSNTTGGSNTFVGTHTGFSNSTGNENSIMGAYASTNLSDGADNSGLGYQTLHFLRHGNYNAALGAYSGWYNQDGVENVFIGYEAGYLTRANFNVFMGAYAGRANTSANGNVFIGYTSGFSNTTGTSNTFIGYETGISNATTNGNTFFGFRSGLANQADNNTFIGTEAGNTNSTGTRNVYTGYQAGTSSTGDDNAFYGYNAGNLNTGSQNTVVGSLANVATTGSTGSTYIGYQSGTIADGNDNTMVGSNSGLNTFVGYSNSFFGTNAGIDIVNGYLNTFIGYQAGTVSALSNLSKAVAIGDNAKVMMSGTMILGNNINVGIGLSGDPTGPTNMLEINSQPGGPSLSGLTFRNLYMGLPSEIAPYGQVLTVDGAGNVVLTDDGGPVTAAINGTSLSGPVVELGNAVGTFAATLLSDREIPMANHNVVFTDPIGINGNKNSIGIGTSSPVAKLDVNRVLSTTTVIQPIAVRIVSSDKSSTGGNSYSLISEANGSNSNNYGGSFTAKNAGINTSVQGLATQTLSGVINDENRASQFDAENGRINFGVLSKAAGGETTYGIDIDASRGTIQNYGLRANVGSSAATVTHNYGINATVNSSTNNKNYGSYSFAGGDLSFNWGVYGWSQSNTSTGTNSSQNIGGYFLGEKGKLNYGVFAEAIGQSTSPTSIGVYAKASGSSVQNYGIYAECLPACSSAVCVNSAGYFRGDVVSTTGYFISSDIKLKNNIVDIYNGLSTINQLLPKTYEFQSTAFPSMTLPYGTHAGLIAEDVATVLPNILKNALQPETHDSLGNVVNPAVDYLAVNYIEIIPYLITAIKEQQQQINDLQTQVINCCGAPRPLAPSQGNNEKTGAIDVKLTNGENSAILFQNEPNPYHSATIIRYFIPQNVSGVKITFQDATGKTLKEVPISETGQGSINVDGSELISGTYTYSLVIGSKIVDVKKMVKVK